MMKLSGKILLLIPLALLCTGGYAQTTLKLGKSNERFSGSTGTIGNISSSMEKMMGARGNDAVTLPYGYSNYNDDRFKDFDDSMKEKSWGQEDTAWERACELDTEEAYRRYVAMYPNGAHIAQANKRLIDKQVDNTLNDAHEELPMLKRVVEDDDSLTSTIVVENATIYPLTVLYSGTDSKKIVIPSGSKGVVTVKNGHYKIAASVPPNNIRPYAGLQSLDGGRYETTYYVVRY